MRTGYPLPWQAGHWLQGQPVAADLVWRHTVYGGVCPLDRLHTTVEQVLGSSEEDVNERVPPGHSALFAVVVNGEGRLLLDSLVLSTAAWATGRARRPGPSDPGWLAGFDATAAQHADEVRELTAAADDDTTAAVLAEAGVAVSGPVTQELFVELVALTAELLGVADLLKPDGIHVHSDLVSRRREHDTQIDFLNSFYIDDLHTVAAAVEGGDCGPALASYLSADAGVAHLPRRDVRDPVVYDRLVDVDLAPARVPAGRWPATPTHPLATSQQLAINMIVDRLDGKHGICAVNGPPGTGKTTMLRDLVAAGSGSATGRRGSGSRRRRCPTRCCPATAASAGTARRALPATGLAGRRRRAGPRDDRGPRDDTGRIQQLAAAEQTHIPCYARTHRGLASPGPAEQARGEEVLQRPGWPDAAAPGAGAAVAAHEADRVSAVDIRQVAPGVRPAESTSTRASARRRCISSSTAGCYGSAVEACALRDSQRLSARSP